MKTSEICKIAFVLSELLNQNFPGLKFQVLSNNVVDIDARGPESTNGAGVFSDKYQIIITEKKISLSIIRSLRLDYHVFELQNPQAIDKIIEIIRDDCR